MRKSNFQSRLAVHEFCANVQLPQNLNPGRFERFFIAFLNSSLIMCVELFGLMTLEFALDLEILPSAPEESGSMLAIGLLIWLNAVVISYMYTNLEICTGRCELYLERALEQRGSAVKES